MKLKIGYSYHIKDAFFDLIKDSYLMSNKENNGYRPHFYVLQDIEDKELFWMIPISSKHSKYQHIYNQKIKKYGRCDTIVLGRFAGVDCAFLIQNAFPTRAKYIDHIHTIQNKPIMVHKEISKKLSVHLKTCLALHKQGKQVFFTNIELVLSVLKNIK